MASAKTLARAKSRARSGPVLTRNDNCRVLAKLPVVNLMWMLCGLSLEGRWRWRWWQTQRRLPMLLRCCRAPSYPVHGYLLVTPFIFVFIIHQALELRVRKVMFFYFMSWCLLIFWIKIKCHGKIQCGYNNQGARFFFQNKGRGCPLFIKLSAMNGIVWFHFVHKKYCRMKLNHCNLNLVLCIVLRIF